MAAIDSDQLRGSSKLILSQLHEKLLKNSASTILWLFDIWSQLEMGKRSESGCLMSWLKIKKNRHFEVSSFILCNNNDPFPYLIVTCDKKCILYNNLQWPAQWLYWEETPKHFPNLAKLSPKKHHDRCLVVCCSSDPLRISESWQNRLIWEVCSANGWDAQ